MKTAIIFVLFSVSFNSLAIPLEAKNGKSEFVAIGRPAALKIVGQGEGPTGNFDLQKGEDGWLLTGEAHLNLESLDTGIELRDQHMKEKYLETGKSKTATLKLTNIKMSPEYLQTGGEAKVAGVLLLHGVEKPVEVQMVFQKEKEILKVSSSFQIKISDFAISTPSFSGITVTDQVQVKVDTQIAQNALSPEASIPK